MTINGINVNSFGAYQFKVTIGHSDIKDSSEWEPHAALPYLAATGISLKTLDITLNLKGTSREEIIRKRSDLLALCTDIADIKLDGFTHRFRGVMAGHKETEVTKWRWHQIDITLSCYEYGEDITETGTGSLTIQNPGNMKSPAVIVITPSINGTIYLAGLLDDEIEIKNVSAGDTIIINGKTGMITDNDTVKAGDVDLWDLPAAGPGETLLTCSDAEADLAMTVTPIFY